MSLKPLPTPLLRVSRPVAACSRCRIAKIKCDGKLPACTACEKNGKAADCTSTNDQFARGKERSYVSTLETRLEKLKARIDEAKARKPSVVEMTDDDPSVPAQPICQLDDVPPTPNTTRVQKRKEVSAMDDFVSAFGILSVNATTRDFYGFTATMTYARLILSACAKDPLPDGIVKALPPRYAVHGLIQYYFDNVFATLPVFEEASFYASLDSVYAQNPSKAEPFDHCLVRLVLAIASASLSEQHGDQYYMDGVGHISAALDQAEAVLHPGSIANVQTLVLLTEYASLAPHHFSSWQFIGAASRAMTDLGLHHDPPKGSVMSKGKLDLRRKVFYCVYVLDRSISMAQTRAFSFSDESAEVKIPFHRQPTSAPTSPQAEGSTPQPWLQSYDLALDVINARQLQSSWYAEIFQAGYTPWEDPYPYLWNTCDAMRTWFENLSPNLPHNTRTYFELDLLNSYIHLLSASPRVPNPVAFARKLTFEYCIRYADLTLRLIGESGHAAPVTFYDALRMHHVGVQFKDMLQNSLDLLLNGLTPPLPDVTPTTAPPPMMPPVVVPQGQSVQRRNIARSIDCIHQIAQCLDVFGTRWGFDSWYQNYQIEMSSIVDDLLQRLREFDEAASMRRQSLWHGGSMGSIHSGSGSTSYPSSQSMHSLSVGGGGNGNGNGGSVAYTPAPSMHTDRGSYGLSPPELLGVGELTTGANPAQQYGSQGEYFAGPPVPVPVMHSWDQQHLAPHVHQHQKQQMYMPNTPGSVGGGGSGVGNGNGGGGSQGYDFNSGMELPGGPGPTNPRQQFANWGGYGGSAMQPSTLDEEAVPPKANPWE